MNSCLIIIKFLIIKNSTSNNFPIEFYALKYFLSRKFTKNGNIFNVFFKNIVVLENPKNNIL